MQLFAQIQRKRLGMLGLDADPVFLVGEQLVLGILLLGAVQVVGQVELEDPRLRCGDRRADVALASIPLIVLLRFGLTLRMHSQ